MKNKLLILALSAAMTLFSCSKDNNGTETEKPIKDIELPSAETPVKSGDPVTIKGVGFTAQSEIWLRAVVKAKAEAATGDVKATVIEATATYLKFAAPTSVSGAQSIVLKQSGKEQVLGTLQFEAAPPVPPIPPTPATEEHLYTVMAGSVYEIAEGTAIKIHTLADGVDMLGAVGVGGKIYYNTIDMETEEISSLKSYDFTTAKETTVAADWAKNGGRAIGVIDGKLHGVKFDATKGLSLVTIADNGTEALVSEFANTTEADIDEMDVIFEYDAVTKVIILSGDSEDGTICVALDLTAKTVVVKTFADVYPENIAYVVADGVVYRFARAKNRSKTTVEKVNAKTLEQSEAVTEFDTRFNSPIYIPSTKLIMGCNINNEILPFNPTTKTLGAPVITTAEEIEILFLSVR